MSKFNLIKNREIIIIQRLIEVNECVLIEIKYWDK